MTTRRRSPTALVPTDLRAEVERVRTAIIAAELAHEAARSAIAEVVPKLLRRVTYRDAAAMLGMSTAAIWKVLDRNARAVTRPARRVA